MAAKKQRKNLGLRKTLPVLLALAVGFGLGQQTYTTLAPAVSVADHDVQACFSPKGGCTALLVQNIQNAQHTIQAAIYCFNSEQIADALINAHSRGIQVRILVDRGQKNVKNTQLPKLHAHDIPIRVARGVKIMHNKIMIIDGSCVLTGSFNWTRPGENKNAENLVCIHSRGVSEHFRDNWEKHWKKAGQYMP